MRKWHAQRISTLDARANSAHRRALRRGNRCFVRNPVERSRFPRLHETRPLKRTLRAPFPSPRPFAVLHRSFAGAQDDRRAGTGSCTQSLWFTAPAPEESPVLQPLEAALRPGLQLRVVAAHAVAV